MYKTILTFLKISQMEGLFLIITSANDETFKQFRTTLFRVSQRRCYYCGTKYIDSGGYKFRPIFRELLEKETFQTNVWFKVIY